jgi:alginate export protein
MGMRPVCLRAAAGVLIVLIGAPVTTLAQPRTYQPDRSDEDWSFLKSAPKTDFWDSLKYIPFGEDWFMTLSGEVRYRPEGFRVRATEGRPSSSDNYLLQRYLFGADVRGPRARVFAELQSGIINGRLRSPRPTDSNTIDVHQAFVEWRQPIGTGSGFNVKVGRQELAIGSTRLISASPGLNVKRSFDGISLGGRVPSFRFAAAVAQLVGLSTGSFDDRADSSQLFWGAAISRRSPRVERRALAPSVAIRWASNGTPRARARA